MSPIRFRFAPQKAAAAIHWIICRQPGIDLHTLLKTFYFADKDHLREHLRPVFGATYRAMRFGPVPLEVYEMAKGEQLWLAELGVDDLPWTLCGYRLNLADPSRNDCAPAMDALSETDIEALAEAHERAKSMTFDQRTQATHQFDWQNADLGIMRYEDMLIGVDDYDQKVEYLRDMAPNMKL